MLIMPELNGGLEREGCLSMFDTLCRESCVETTLVSWEGEKVGKEVGEVGGREGSTTSNPISSEKFAGNIDEYRNK